jgi:hypothetical protein
MMTRQLREARLLPFAAALLLVASAHASVKLSFEMQSMPAQQQDASTIDSLLALRALSLAEVLEKYSFTKADIETGAAYEKLEAVTAIGSKTSLAPYFFYRKEKLVMIYFTAETLSAKRLTVADFVKRFGERNIKLRSRAGKTHHLVVYPALGAAFSTDGATLDFLEIFPPTTRAKYLREIYREVAPFVK